MSLWRVVFVAAVGWRAGRLPADQPQFDLGGLVGVTGGAGPASGADGAFTRGPSAGGAAGTAVGRTQPRTPRRCRCRWPRTTPG